MLFPIHFVILLSFMVTYSYLTKQMRNINLQISYCKAISVLLGSFFLGAVIVETLKIFFSFPRPYCIGSGVAVNKNLIHMLGNDFFLMSKCNKSFPSGHSWYIATFVFSVWGIMNIYLKIIGLATIFLVGLSRVMLGMHFPADVDYSILIAFIVCFAMHKVVGKFFSTYDRQIRAKLLSL